MRSLLPFLFLLTLFFPSASVHADDILVLPFMNRTGRQDLNWIEESFVESLNLRLAGEGRVLISREERLAVLERMGLPTQAHFTRASLIRLGEELGVDWLVVGEFQTGVDGSLETTARVLDLRQLSLAPAIRVIGPLTQLIEVQSNLAWEILRQRNRSLHINKEAFAEKFHRYRLSAFESYLRGLNAPSREQQLRYFLQAARLEPSYSAAAFQLGRLYLENQDYASALSWLGKVDAEDPYWLDSLFYQGLCRYFQRNYAAAAAAWQRLLERVPAVEVHNNLALALSRQGREEATEIFRQAQERWPEETDLYLNLALHHARRQNWAAAAAALQPATELVPGDTEVYYLLAHALEKLGRVEEAAEYHHLAVGDNPALGLSLQRRLLELDRVKLYFHAPAALRTLRHQHSEMISGRTADIDLRLQRGQELLRAGELDRAQREFVEAILLAPDSYEAYFALSEIYRRQGRLPEAIAELKAALWTQETLPARLAELYLSQQRLTEAREQVQAALVLDPTDVAARQMEKELDRASGVETAREEERP